MNRTTQSALLVAGAAAGVAAAAWIGKRRLTAVNPPSLELVEDEELVEPESAELPIGRSADPDIDDTLSRHLLPQDETSGSALLGNPEPFADESTTDASLDEVWNSLPGVASGEQTEGYDAVSPEDLGSVWLERATETTHEARPHGTDPSDMPDLDNLVVSEATLASSHLLDDDDDDDDGQDVSADDASDDEDDDERIEDDALG